MDKQLFLGVLKEFKPKRFINHTDSELYLSDGGFTILLRSIVSKPYSQVKPDAIGFRLGEKIDDYVKKIDVDRYSKVDSFGFGFYEGLDKSVALIGNSVVNVRLLCSITNKISKDVDYEFYTAEGQDSVLLMSGDTLIGIIMATRVDPSYTT